MIKARVIMESQGKPAKHVERSLRDLIGKMKTYRGIEIYDQKFEPVEKVKDTDLFSALADVGVEAKDFGSFITLILQAGPTAVIMLEPDKLEVKIGELQAALNDLLNIIHGLASQTMESQLAMMSAVQKK